MYQHYYRPKTRELSFACSESAAAMMLLLQNLVPRRGGGGGSTESVHSVPLDVDLGGCIGVVAVVAGFDLWFRLSH